jgi:hypothetical protein
VFIIFRQPVIKETEMKQDKKSSKGKIISAQSPDHSEMTPLANENMMRRDWLKSVMIGGVGLGLFGIPLALSAEEEKAVGCPRIIRVSKNMRARIVEYQCKPCQCGNDRVYLISFVFKGELYSNKVCDESLKMIPDKSIATGKLSFTLRGGICPETRNQILWGCHEGKATLYAPTGKPLFDAALFGTEGVNPQASVAAKRCCWPYAEGALRGNGAEEMKTCSICTTYHIKVPFNANDPCTKTPPSALSMQLDGTLKCPC